MRLRIRERAGAEHRRKATRQWYAMPKPTTLEEALEEIEKLKAEKGALQVKLTAAKWSGGAKLAKAQLGVASARGAGAKLLTTLSGKGISQVMKEDGVTTVRRVANGPATPLGGRWAPT